MALGNVLVIRPGALGDAVLTLPALGALFAAGAERVTLLGTPASWAFLSGTQRRDFHIADFASSQWLGLFADGAALSDDAKRTLQGTQTAIVYLNGDTSAIQHRLLKHGVATISVMEPPTATPSVVASPVARCFELNWRNLSEEHAARSLLEPLAHCCSDASLATDALNPERVSELGWLAHSNDSSATAMEERPDTFAVHPGSGGRRKCWAARRFAEFTERVARDMNLRPLVFFGPADEGIRAEFEAAMSGDVVWNAIENRPLREVVALLQSSRFFVGNDSGMSHLAALVTPVVAIFGPTDPNIWGPLGRCVKIVQAPQGDLNLLAAATVFEAAASIM